MRTIDLSVEIQAPAEKVWRALATPEQIARWFAPVVTGGTAIGDKILFQWYPGGEYSKTVTARDEGRHLSFGGGALVIDWFIESKPGGVTILRLVNSGFGDRAEWDDMYDATAGGWRYFLFNLRDYVEHHAGEPRTIVIERREVTEPHAASMARARANLPPGFRVVADEAPARLWGTLPDHGNGLLLIENEPGADRHHYGVYLSLYGAAKRYEGDLKPYLARMVSV
jgi:uncharacterized protein YndB with AHSA1/START domain